MSHTSTPWGNLYGRYIVSQEDAARHICRVFNTKAIGFEEEYPDDEGDANAEFIVRAANNHDELLEAARLALFWMRSHPDKPANSMAQIEEAITKATGSEEGKA